MLPKSKIIIFKFPFKSFFSGVEKHTFKVVEMMQNKGLEFLLLSSCPIMLSEFKKKGWENQRWWAGLEPKTRGTKVLFLFTALPAMISLIVSLIYYKSKGYNKIYCLSLTEKLLVTPWAKMLGFKVYWLEIMCPQKQFKDKLFNGWYQWCADKARIIVISKHIKEELINQGIGSDKIKVIYDGLEIEQYKKQQDFFELMVDKKFWPLERYRYHIGFVGRLNYDKGLHVLIKAMQEVKKEIPEVRLTIVGEGAGRQKLEWLIEHYEVGEVVKLVGYKEDFMQWLWGFDLFVMPSLHEAFGITVAQAMLCAKPVVASKVGGLPEIINHEKTGYLVEPNNSEVLARAIIKVHKNKEQTEMIALAGRQFVIDNFDLRKMEEEFYRELVG